MAREEYGWVFGEPTIAGSTASAPPAQGCGHPLPDFLKLHLWLNLDIYKITALCHELFYWGRHSGGDIQFNFQDAHTTRAAEPALTSIPHFLSLKPRGIRSKIYVKYSASALSKPAPLLG